MRIMYKQPGLHWEFIKIQGTLEELQELVGGYIEIVTTEPGWTVICNEDGRILDLDFNCSVNGIRFYGPIIIIGVKDCDFTDAPADPALWD